MTGTAILSTHSSVLRFAGLMTPLKALPPCDIGEASRQSLDPFKISWTELLKGFQNLAGAIQVRLASDDDIVLPASELPQSDVESPIDPTLAGVSSSPNLQTVPGLIAANLTRLDVAEMGAVDEASVEKGHTARKGDACKPHDVKQHKPEANATNQCNEVETASAGFMTLPPLSLEVSSSASGCGKESRSARIKVRDSLNAEAQAPQLKALSRMELLQQPASPCTQAALKNAQGLPDLPSPPKSSPIEPRVIRTNQMKDLTESQPVPPDRCGPAESIVALSPRYESSSEIKYVGFKNGWIGEADAADIAMPARVHPSHRIVPKQGKTDVASVRESAVSSAVITIAEHRGRALVGEIDSQLRDTMAISSTALPARGDYPFHQSQGNPLRAADEGMSSSEMHWLHLDPKHAEAGLRDPYLGWITVRAESGSGGVHASIVSPSEQASQVLTNHMEGLKTHLLGSHLPIQELMLLRTDAFAPHASLGAFGDQANSGANREHREDHQFSRPGDRDPSARQETPGCEEQDVFRVSKDDLAGSHPRVSLVA